MMRRTALLLLLSLLTGTLAAAEKTFRLGEVWPDDSFGRCEACGRSIAKARLDAIPYAAFCVKCASRQEKEA